jgi:hypothetical protein
MLAEAAAFREVDEHRLGQEALARAVRSPLELVMASIHMIDQVFHPQEGGASVSHPGVSIRLVMRCRRGRCGLVVMIRSRRRVGEKAKAVPGRRFKVGDNIEAAGIIQLEEKFIKLAVTLARWPRCNDYTTPGGQPAFLFEAVGTKLGFNGVP